MKAIYLITLVLLLTNCTIQSSEETPCDSKFERGDKVTFIQNDEINGIVLRTKSYDCHLYVVSYFTKMGKNEVGWFREMELELNID